MQLSSMLERQSQQKECLIEHNTKGHSQQLYLRSSKAVVGGSNPPESRKGLLAQLVRALNDNVSCKKTIKQRWLTATKKSSVNALICHP